MSKTSFEAQLDKIIGLSNNGTTLNTELLSEYQYSTTTPKPVEYVLDGFIANKLTLIAGAPGVGKSTALVSLAAIVAGLMKAEGIASELNRQVFYVTEDTEQVERILYGMRAQHLISVAECEVAKHFKIIHANRRPAEQVAQMIERARSIGINQHKSGYAIEPLIVLDTANATLDLDNENDNAEAGKAIAAIKQSMGNAAIWIVGHTSKPLKRADLANLSFRGASAFEGDTNAASYLFKDESSNADTTYLALGKHRYVSDYQEVQINATGGSVAIQTPWGTEQVCRYRVGIPSRSSAKHREDAKKEQTAEAISLSHEKLKKQIVYAVLNANNQGEQINRERLKPLIGGKAQTVLHLVNELITDGFLKNVKAEGKRGFNLEALKEFVDVGTIGNDAANNLLNNAQL